MRMAYIYYGFHVVKLHVSDAIYMTLWPDTNTSVVRIHWKCAFEKLKRDWEGTNYDTN